jgi:hypothetical protein
VSLDGLPVSLGLVRAADRSDWRAVREELRTVIDSATTDGVYGERSFSL